MTGCVCIIVEYHYSNRSSRNYHSSKLSSDDDDKIPVSLSPDIDTRSRVSYHSDWLLESLHKMVFHANLISIISYM